MVAYWIAEGAQGKHLVRINSGRYRELTATFAFREPEDDYAPTNVVAVGGHTEEYRHEISQVTQNCPRTAVWQTLQDIYVAPVRPQIVVNADEAKWAADYLKQFNGKPVLLLAPFSNYATRSWPKIKFLRLCEKITQETDYAVVTVDQFAERAVGFPNLITSITLPRLAHLIRAVDIVVGNDSGVAHLAGTVGKPTFAIMGPTHPTTVFGHIPNVVPIQISLKKVPCVGCHFSHAKGYVAACDTMCVALDMLTVDEVYTKIFHG